MSEDFAAPCAYCARWFDWTRFPPERVVKVRHPLTGVESARVVCNACLADHPDALEVFAAHKKAEGVE